MGLGNFKGNSSTQSTSRMSLLIPKHPRIIAFPLTRPPISASSKLNSLIYYQFQFIPDKRSKLSIHKDSGASNSKERSLFKDGFVNWASQKASDIWAGFGRAQGWRLKLYQAGGKLVDRIDFEELALKSIDPSLGPSIRHLGKSRFLSEKREKVEYEQPRIPLLYPPSIMSSSAILSELLVYSESRIPRHKRGFYFWMLVTPLTMPFMLIPVIPNIPFFFCVWRSWSHYRAYKASQYLQSLLQHDMIIPEASEALDQVYKTHPTATPLLLQSSHNESGPSTAFRTHFESSSSQTSQSRHELLLTRDTVPAILEALDFESGSTVAGDLYRAVDQARIRVEEDKI